MSDYTGRGGRWYQCQPLTVSGVVGDFFPSRAHPSTPTRVDPPPLIFALVKGKKRREIDEVRAAEMWAELRPFQLEKSSFFMLEPREPGEPRKYVEGPLGTSQFERL